jgi:hypothetical protein
MKKFKKIVFTIPVMVMVIMCLLTVSVMALMINTLQTVKPMAAAAISLPPSTPLGDYTDYYAGRLDQHSGEMMPGATPLMAYQTADLQGQENHYICAGDWFDYVSTSNSSVQLTYPITIKNGKGDLIETHYFNLNDWQTYGDGTVGAFTPAEWDEYQWYKYLPSGGMQYVDDKKGESSITYLSVNTPFHLTPYDTNGHRKLLCDSAIVMEASDTPTSWCYYDYNHTDLKDADWGWIENQAQPADKDFIQGTNIIYAAGMDRAGNFVYIK